MTLAEAKVLAVKDLLINLILQLLQSKKKKKEVLENANSLCDISQHKSCLFVNKIRQDKKAMKTK